MEEMGSGEEILGFPRSERRNVGRWALMWIGSGRLAFSVGYMDGPYV